MEVWSNQSAAKTYVLSGFEFVPGKHPNFDAGLLQVFYCFWNLFLELIFHRRGSQDKQSTFKFIVDLM
jgi:hypothetical protein